MRSALIVGVVVSVTLFVFSAQAEVPRLMSYQGKVTDGAGVPVSDGDYTIQFRIYTASSGGDMLWDEEQTVTVEEGLFSVLLGDVDPIPDTVFTGSARYLALQVSPDPEMSERKAIVSAGYAFYDGDWILIDSILYAAGDYGLSMRQSNTLHGDSAYTHVNLGCGSTTGSPGEHVGYCTVGGGLGNRAFGMEYSYGPGYATVSGGRDNEARDEYSTVGGGYQNEAVNKWSTVSGGKENTAAGVEGGATIGGGVSNQTTGDYSTIAGGLRNTADDPFATVAGGADNTAAGWWAPTVGGGENNTASSGYTTVSGGYLNTASGERASVGGGIRNTASGPGATVGGGNSDTAMAVYGGVFSGYSNLAGDEVSDTAAFVGGGRDNTAGDEYATVSGGYGNTASGGRSTVGGGRTNTASAWQSTVGGGYHNEATNDYATIAGGDYGLASGPYSTIAGGSYNDATHNYTTVGGGDHNAATGEYATVGGGWDNHAQGYCATVAGGRADTAGGNYSFAAGRGVKLTNLADYTFAYGVNFTSSTPNAVIFHNSSNEIKVGIGVTNPANILTVQLGSATDPIADAWTLHSSKRWKTNVEPISGAVDKVRKLRGVYFDWKKNGEHDIGLIAEEVGEVIPEVVAYEENGEDAKSVDYARLVALLVEAVKGQQREIDSLREEVNVLRKGR